MHILQKVLSQLGEIKPFSIENKKCISISSHNPYEVVGNVIEAASVLDPVAVRHIALAISKAQIATVKNGYIVYFPEIEYLPPPIDKR